MLRRRGTFRIVGCEGWGAVQVIVGLDCNGSMNQLGRGRMRRRRLGEDRLGLNVIEAREECIPANGFVLQMTVRGGVHL